MRRGHRSAHRVGASVMAGAVALLVLGGLMLAQDAPLPAPERLAAPEATPAEGAAQ